MTETGELGGDRPVPAENVRLGTAGWAIPREQAARFRTDAPGLVRYSEVLRCVEINSTFYRPHRPSTFARWSASVPENFRFAVKAPKAITHEGALAPIADPLRTFLAEVGQLGPKLGPILFQLPPRQAFEEGKAKQFLSMFRELYPAGPAVVEPRHPSWFSPEAETLLGRFHVGRVAADPAIVAAAALPGGEVSLVYYRLHGSPRTYYSSYPDTWLRQLAAAVRKAASESEVWCIFDNTASGAAMGNVLDLQRLLAADTEQAG